MNKEQGQMPAITVHNQYVKDLSLEIPHAPQIFKEFSENPQISLNVEVKADPLEGNLFNVALNFKIEGKIKEKHLFILELVYAAVVGLNVPKEHLEAVLMVEIPRLLFPFARNIISNNLVNAGLPPFMINPIDFAAMYQAKVRAGKAN